MPELLDVEGRRRYLAEYARGRRIAGVHVLDPEIVRNRSAQALGRALTGGRFVAPERHGKWLIAPVSEVRLLIHFGMTGDLVWAAKTDQRHRHDRRAHRLLVSSLSAPLTPLTPLTHGCCGSPPVG
jgi:formamidopyrimidine-DNA glycosylase